jgi:hypothetical protein
MRDVHIFLQVPHLETVVEDGHVDAFPSSMPRSIAWQAVLAHDDGLSVFFWQACMHHPGGVCRVVPDVDGECPVPLSMYPRVMIPGLLARVLEPA